jgi:predicted nucleic-acid-binding Zn-ribbon protein
MKKIFLLMVAAIMLWGINTHATIITVSNAPNSPGQYTNLQEALNEANPGDTIYVSGSLTTYGNIDIKKQITLIGAGFNPNNQNNQKSELQYVYFKSDNDPVNPSNPSGTTITGFRFLYLFVQTQNINDIQLLRNEITGQISLSSYYCQNWTVKNNILNYISSAGTSTIYASDFVISNNIIKSNIQYFNSNTILIANNIFTQGSGFTTVSLANIQNNIFYGGSTANCSYCTFIKNISVGAGNTFDYGTNTSIDNFTNVNPLFVDVASTTFNFAYDYHLQPSSPGIDAGTDGTDIGIYGGMYPFPSGGDVPWQTSPMPAIPQITSMVILNGTLPSAGTLHIQIQAKSQE